MFNLQGSELVIILLLALVVLGPEKLPDAMRKAGKAYSELKKMSSGFQSEFRSVVDEPMREIRETANVLRDSADFTKLQDGNRDEKPKSGEMAPIDPDMAPVDETPTFESPEAAGPATSPDSAPAPFDGVDPALREPVSTEPTPIPVPGPFAGMSSTAPRPKEAADPSDEPPSEPNRPQPYSGVSSAAPRTPETTRASDDQRVDADRSSRVDATDEVDADSDNDAPSVVADHETADADGDR